VNNAVTDQTSAAAAPTVTSPAAPVTSAAPSSPKPSATTITGEITADASVTSSEPADEPVPMITPDTDMELEHIVLSTGEDGMDLVVLPADTAEPEEDGSGMNSILLTILIGAVVVGMIAVAAAGFVQMRREE